jgi:SAM-dependent methyltransferase
LKSKQCDVCSSEIYELFISEPINYEEYGKSDISFNYMQCSSCRSLFSSKIISKNDLKGLYPRDYLLNDSEPRLVGILVKLFYILKSLGIFIRYRKVKSVRILDFGSGDAQLIKALAKYGKFEVVGYDPYIDREKINNTLFIKELEKLKLQPKFDLILVNHVLEHVTNLRETLVLLLELISGQGKIIGVTPNPNHWLLNFSMKKWGYLHYPQHLRVISKKGLRRVLESISDYKTIISFKNNIINTCYAYTVEHTYKEIFGYTTNGHWRYDKLIVILFLPFNLVEKILTRNLASYTFEITLNDM